MNGRNVGGKNRRSDRKPTERFAREKILFRGRASTESHHYAKRGDSEQINRNHGNIDRREIHRPKGSQSMRSCTLTVSDLAVARSIAAETSASGSTQLTNGRRSTQPCVISRIASSNTSQ